VRPGEERDGEEVGFRSESRGMKWKQHIYEEHNLKQMLRFLIYLLDRPDKECTDKERAQKSLALRNEEGFFDSLKVESKVNRLKASFHTGSFHPH
jgi:hypothetical protein